MITVVRCQPQGRPLESSSVVVTRDFPCGVEGMLLFHCSLIGPHIT